MKTLSLLTFCLFFSQFLLAQVDHSEIIEGPFSSPQEVTETCLMCHEGLDQDIMLTRHWTWSGGAHGEGTGKFNIINNYCIALTSNYPRCTSCHIGYGWKDESFDFTDGRNIDCLICHDQTGTYKKVPTGAGMPDPEVDLVAVAASVGPTSVKNCGICHFNGGGGTGVKHGDLDGSIYNASAELDIHMGGLEFTCSDCHAGENHAILGASHGSLATGENHIGCIDCHGEMPHRRKLVNDHISAVACETCHIPTFAREEPTKTWWDWSTAGKKKEAGVDEYGMPLYDNKKGDFKWDKNIVPEYRWHNGQADYYKYGDKFEDGSVVELNSLTGSIEDPTAKITPFKLMRGKQIYDSKNMYLIVPKLFGPGGYWATFNWKAAAKLGMQAIKLPFSGKYKFIETEMYWPINHMVAPAHMSLRCTECHSSRGSQRLNWEELGYDGDPIKTGSRKF